MGGSLPRSAFFFSRLLEGLRGELKFFSAFSRGGGNPLEGYSLEGRWNFSPFPREPPLFPSPGFLKESSAAPGRPFILGGPVLQKARTKKGLIFGGRKGFRQGVLARPPLEEMGGFLPLEASIKVPGPTRKMNFFLGGSFRRVKPFQEPPDAGVGRLMTGYQLKLA